MKKLLPCLILTAGLVCGFCQEWVDVVLLGLSYIVILAITSIQTRNSVRLQAELRTMRTSRTDISPGQHTTPQEMHVNDTLNLHPGDIVTADTYLTEGCCTVDPSLVTGVKSVVTKYQGDNLYQGYMVLEGDGKGIVTAVGKDTFIGKNTNSKDATPEFNSIEKLDLRFMWHIKIVCWTLLFFLAIIQFNSSQDVFSVLSLLVSLSLISDTSFLNIICKTLISKGTEELIKSKAVPIDLNQVENLAQLDTLCIDKELFVLKSIPLCRDIWLYCSKHDFELYRAAALVPPVLLDEGPDFLEQFSRNHLIATYNVDVSGYQVKDVQKYSPDTKYATVTIHQYWDNPEFMCVKGLPGVVLALCHDSAATSLAREKIEEFSQAKLNCIAVASRSQTGWRFLGLIPYQMTMVPVTTTLHKAEEINLKVICLADWPQSLHKALAADLGMRQNRVYPSEILTEPNSDALLLDADGFSDLTPGDRYTIATRLRKHNRHVAMVSTDTSDYPTFPDHLDVAIALPNSVPALKAKSHLQMYSQSLEDIVTAVSQAKRTWTAVQRCCAYFLVCNAQVLVFFLVASVTVSGNDFTNRKNIPGMFVMPGFALISLAVLKSALQYSVLSSQLPLIEDCKFQQWKAVLMAVLLCGIGVSTSVIVLLVTLRNVEFNSLDWLSDKDWKYRKVQTAVWLKLALSEVFTLLALHISWRHAWKSTRAKVWLYYILYLILPLSIAWLLPKSLQFLEVLFVFMLAFLSFLGQLLVQLVINHYFSLLSPIESLEIREESAKHNSHSESSYPPFKDCQKFDELISKRDRRNAAELNRAS